MNTFDAWNEMEKERKQRKENAPCSEWISVKERLPENKPEKCLCYSEKGDFMVGAYTNWGWMFPCYFEKVTHWMPLPEPPKEGDGEDGN